MDIEILHFTSEYEKLVEADRSLGELFYDQVQRQPSAIAIDSDQSSITYGELHARSSHLAHQLISLSILLEEPIGIVVKHGIGDIVAQIAIIYAGGSCVPIDPSLPDKRIRTMLEFLEVRYIIVDDENSNRDLPFHQLCIKPTNNNTAQNFRVVPGSLEHRTHIIHTSGTTSAPKAVQIAAQSILHVAFHAPFEPLATTDVVAHCNSSSFDVSLFEIWAPLMIGARIAIVQKATMLDPMVMADRISVLGVTVMIFTASILNLVASTYPQAIENLRICLFGGEAANLTTVRKIFQHGPPGMLVNAYGPTECCIFCFAHLITLQDVHDGIITIGHPIGRNVAHIVDSSVAKPDQGELLVGGPCLSKGYVNRPNQNSKSFTAKNGVRLYHTGDIVERQQNGETLYIGRRDRQVKIRGIRIELEAVELALLKTGFFTAAVAMRFEMPQEGAGSILLAFVIHGPSVAHSHTLETKTIRSEITKKLRESLPSYMVPQLEFISTMPLNSHDKVDHNKLSEQYHQRWRLTEEPRLPSATIIQLALLWIEILGTQHGSGEVQQDCMPPESDFFGLGGTSLQASMLISCIRQNFGSKISLLTLYQNSTLGALCYAINLKPDGRPDISQGEDMAWKNDTKLADNFSLPAGVPVDWCSDGEGRIFLTGATGFVGVFMLVDLLQLRHVKQVACLIRATDVAVGFQRLRAAMTNISCFGPTGYITGATVLKEDEPLSNHVEAIECDDGYSQSQWVVEENLRSLMDRSFPVAIYRPGFVTGHSQSGISNPDDFVSRMILGCAELGYYPKLPNQRKEFVPVDYVSSAVLKIAAAPNVLGRAYHIVPPEPAISIDMDSTMQMVGACSGRQMECVTYKDWVSRLAANPPKTLQPLLPMLEEEIRDGLTHCQLYERMPVYDSANTTMVLSSDPDVLVYPVLDQALMKKYWDFLNIKA
ncbi:related to non-ribosomal peptide synthetase modules and related proteins [Rhynchosporium agropyri]|uniref:Related to non-ribosomal peptide synthetase modules and related proteins n=1 Tax=Rhynchosporium agropyri TaxID=914238 RepID=A0A1E1KBG6_9HELO|nr:related to non-ribosomal peptide synthetase modules and related proteins [Rhynchosporium agropyri]